MEKKIQPDKLSEYYNMVYRFTVLQLHSQPDAQDVTQEVFFRYYKKLPTFKNEEQARAWFFRVAMNLCKNFWRSPWHKKDELLDEQIMSEEPDPMMQMIIKEEEQKVLDTVYSLPVKYREVVHLYYFEGMSVKQIARITKRNASTIQTQLARARGLIEKRLKEM